MNFICSTDSGWDNPFRPGGDLSREADEIVNMIKGEWSFCFFFAVVSSKKVKAESSTVHSKNIDKINFIANAIKSNPSFFQQ